MSNLQHRQTKIQDKRKTTPWRDFVMEICSWWPVNLYKNKGLISRYPPTGREGIIESNKTYNRENIISYDDLGNEDFLKKFQELFLSSTKPSITQFVDNEGSEFVDMAYGCKNSYLSFSAGISCENILYSACVAVNLVNIYNSFSVTDGCNNVYASRVITTSYNIFYSFNIHNSSNIRFSSNLIGCSECIFCDNLENQSWCIKNISYSKEEFEIKKKEILSEKDNFLKFTDGVSKIGTNYQSNNVLNSSATSFSEKIENSFATTRTFNGRNIYYGIGSEGGGANMFDGIDVGINSSDFYAVVGSGTDSNHFYCSCLSGLGSNIFYSMSLEGCSFCLGCIGLKNKSYCILNKQYSKEEWYQKVDEIFGQMEADGTLGEFFPATMNPFYFNDTAAYLIDPSFTKEEVVAKGYLWRDEPIQVDIPANAEIVKVEELEKYEGWRHPEGNEGSSTNRNGLDSSSFQSSEGQHRHIDPSIMKKIIQDEQGNVYRIVPMEYEFLMKHGLPLPRKHWLDRMKENFRIG